MCPIQFSRREQQLLYVSPSELREECRGLRHVVPGRHGGEVDDAGLVLGLATLAPLLLPRDADLGVTLGGGVQRRVTVLIHGEAEKF